MSAIPYIKELLGLLNVLEGALILAGFAVSTLLADFKELAQTRDLAVSLLFQEIGDLFELVEALIWAVHDDVVHDFDQVSVEVLAARVLRRLENVSQVIEMLDLCARVSANDGCLLRVLCLSCHLNLYESKFIYFPPLSFNS